MKMFSGAVQCRCLVELYSGECFVELYSGECFVELYSVNV